MQMLVVSSRYLLWLCLPFLCLFAGGQKKPPPIIGATCAFDAKIYKNVGGVFDVSPGRTGNKKKVQISDFCSALPSLLVE
ncbi:MAG: hypothetical protein WBC05_09175, partial [Sedimentisphaerales bacterium]